MVESTPSRSTIRFFMGYSKAKYATINAVDSCKWPRESQYRCLPALPPSLIMVEMSLLPRAAWLLHNPVVTSPIVGPRTMDQLTSSLRALKLKLNPDTLKKLDAIWPGPGGEAPKAYAW